MKALLEILRDLLSLVKGYVNTKKQDRKVDAIKNSYDAVSRARRFLHKDSNEN